MRPACPRGGALIVTSSIPVGLCQCGCGQTTSVAKVTNARYGHVKGRPTSYARGHKPGNPGPAYRVTEHGCWEWLRRRHPDGYGTVWVGRRAVLAHCFYWQQINGPVPTGMELDHTCRNRACVNPAHLEPVTHLENVRRGARTKLDRDAVAALCAQPYENYRQAAARFGVSPHHVLKIRRAS